MQQTRPVHWRRHDNGVDSWTVADADPAPALARWINGYCDYREATSSFTTRREVPNSCAVMIIHLGTPISLVGGDGQQISLCAGQGFVAGLHMRSALSHTQGTQAGIHVFLPIASLHAMLGVDMGEITNRVLPLDVVFGPKGLELGLRMVEANDIESRFQVLDAAIGQRLGDMKAADRVVDWAVTQLHANPNINITSLAADIGWSRKHLVDRFRRHIGAGPRAFGRLLRFERAWSDAAAAATPNWAYLAASHGYADQSHLIHDFRAFSGFTPTELAARLLPHGGGIIES